MVVRSSDTGGNLVVFVCDGMSELRVRHRCGKELTSRFSWVLDFNILLNLGNAFDVTDQIERIRGKQITILSLKSRLWRLHTKSA